VAVELDRYYGFKNDALTTNRSRRKFATKVSFPRSTDGPVVADWAFFVVFFVLPRIAGGRTLYYWRWGA
jgi:hypothetical protein